MTSLLRRRPAYLLAVPLLAVSLGACGGDDDDNSGPAGSAGATTKGAGGKSSGGSTGGPGTGGSSAGGKSSGGSPAGGSSAGGSSAGHSSTFGTGGTGDPGAGGTEGTPGAGGTEGGTGGTPGTGGTEAGGSGPVSGHEGQYCVDKINSYRATLGLPALARWTDGEVCADGEAKSDSETQKAHGAFGQCSEGAQDECPGWPGPEKSLLDGCLDLMWKEGPGDDYSKHGHYINMSNKDYTQVACGFYQTPNGSYWAVQNFR